MDGITDVRQSQRWQHALRLAAPQDRAQRHLVSLLAMSVGAPQSRHRAQRVVALQRLIRGLDAPAAARMHRRLTNARDPLRHLYLLTLRASTRRGLLMLLDAKRRQRVPPTRLLSSEIGQVIREAPPTGGSPGPTLPSPPTGLGIPDHLKLKFAATVLAEGYSDGSEDLDIVWIYYNLVVVKGMGETGLRRSSQFDSKYGTPPQAPVPKYLFKLYMAALGDRTYSNVPTEDKNPDVVKKYPTIGDFVHPLEGHPYFLRATPTIGPGVSRARVDKLMNFLATQDPSKNPYSGWFGQGSRVDFNRDDGKWRKARAYYRLQLQGFQLQGKPLPEYVKKLKATYIFHEDAIIKFFTDNPGLLPEQVQVPKEP